MNAHKKQNADEPNVPTTTPVTDVKAPDATEKNCDCEDYKNKYLRALADYQNLERRMSDERQEIMRAAQIRVLTRLLPFLDNLDKAELFIKDPGLKMIRDQYNQELTAMGLKAIDVLDKEYDPHTAEAIDVVEGKTDNIVVEVLQRGFMFGDRVIRPAQVKVSRTPEKKEA